MVIAVRSADPVHAVWPQHHKPVRQRIGSTMTLTPAAMIVLIPHIYKSSNRSKSWKCRAHRSIRSLIAGQFLCGSGVR
jgi:hypothetical protein